ncbi:MAG: zinc-binding dehydrogenase [Acidimicrobiales bacterium]
MSDTSTNPPDTTRQIRSTVTPEGTVRVTLDDVELGRPAAGEVVVRVEATPINPSDLGTLLAMADLTSLRSETGAGGPALVADIPAGVRAGSRSRLGEPLPVGNEGAGTVIAAGPGAEHLLGRTVAMLGGSMYAEHRRLTAAETMPLPDGTPARDGASCFVNPLTALGMVETMRLDGHQALIHTAAASNLGQMLVRICLADDIPLVNVVRRPAQAELLAGLGARYVIDTSTDAWWDDLVAALTETGATVAFDAIGGGRLAGRLLSAMEAAITARSGASGFARYGSATHKQVYIYGGLDRGPTELNRGFGMAWGIGGWLLTNFLNRVGPETGAALRRRVIDELTTTFASHYTATIGLDEMLEPDLARQYAAQATGSKYLVTPAG